MRHEWLASNDAVPKSDFWIMQNRLKTKRSLSNCFSERCVYAAMLWVYGEVCSVNTARSVGLTQTFTRLMLCLLENPLSPTQRTERCSMLYQFITTAWLLQYFRKGQMISLYTPWLGKTLCKHPNRLHCFRPLSRLLPAFMQRRGLWHFKCCINLFAWRPGVRREAHSFYTLLNPFRKRSTCRSCE